ncbi:MAG: 30S ribosomal protein S6 [Bdellovibrionales bacterium]
MNKDQDLRFYEEVLVLHPDSTEKEQKAVYVSSSEVIKEHEGKVYKVDTWGSRPIANVGSKKISRGIYFHMVFSATGQAIKELKRRLLINNRVVYFHYERLPKKETPENHIEKFKKTLEETALIEKEKQERMQKKQMGSHK